MTLNDSASFLFSHSDMKKISIPSLDKNLVENISEAADENNQNNQNFIKTPPSTKASSDAAKTPSLLFDSKAEAKRKKKEKKGMNDLAFKFPIKKEFNKIEIPFAFQQENNHPKDNHFHSYITIKETPKLYIDISDEQKTSSFYSVTKMDELKKTNEDYKKILSLKDGKIKESREANEEMREEIERLEEEIRKFNEEITALTKTRDAFIKSAKQKSKETLSKSNAKNSLYYSISKKMSDLISDYVTKTDEEKERAFIDIKKDIDVVENEHRTSNLYYNNKFNCSFYNKNYITKTLQNNILAFKDFVNNKITKIKPKVNVVINNIQSAVNASIGPEFIVQLYGSHATNLCLPWSDLDVVLRRKDGKINDKVDSFYFPLHELYKYLNVNSDDFKSINYIGSTTVPLIKCKLKEKFVVSSLDISLQDNSHYGINCVDLILKYLKEFEALRPMVLALKNILKEASLNEPYKVSKCLYFIYCSLGRFEFLWSCLVSCSFSEED